MQVMSGLGGGMIPNNFCVERFADVFLVARFLVARFLVAIFSPFGKGLGHYRFHPKPRFCRKLKLMPGRYPNEIDSSIRFGLKVMSYKDEMGQ